MRSMVTLLAILSGLAVTCLAETLPPQPYGPVPSERQLKWHEMEFYGFLHFTVNTFTDKEWGYGDEKESTFNPTAFDAEQIVEACKAAGMSKLILTCKHHDGFCLWPSKFTEHSVKNSVWKDGKGDAVREISDACKKRGLKFGVYLSPWDRNHKDYGKPEYVDYYRNQLRELLTNYGPICEVWQDGANGGDGYYGGAREHRGIDNKVYYDWANTNKIIRDLAPDACIFSDVGPDCRWVGNEAGVAGDPCWATIDTTGWVPGVADSQRLNSGDRGGKQWLPAEVDVSIRPGWFYHAAEDKNVRSPENLKKLYFESVGRGANLLLNVPPDRRGLVHENDKKSLAEFGRWLKETFATDLASQAVAKASNIRGGDVAHFGPQNLIDGNHKTYWATDDATTTAEVVLQFDKPITFNIVRLREYLPLGQRVEDFALDYWIDSGWKEFYVGKAIGACRLARTTPATSTKVRLRILKSPVCPAISEFGLFAEPATDVSTESTDHFLNLLRTPDSVTAITEANSLELPKADDAAWRGDGIEVGTKATQAGVQVELSAPETAVKYLKLRWNGKLPGGEWRYLGDAWERGYGNLQWLPLDKNREMPWYFLASDKTFTHGYGVMTAPAAFCDWKADDAGVTLTLDVRNGGRGVQLGNRSLAVCTVVCRQGGDKETPFASAHDFCRMMCPKPLMPKQPVYGFNDWYCDYGKNSAESVRWYTEFLVRLSPKGENRPFMVIDDGWQPDGGNGGGGPWDRSGSNFPSMAETAAEIKMAGARPGIWIRLMSHHKEIPQSWRIENKRGGLDLTKPEVRAYVKKSIAQLHQWGYELIKHDFSTFDITDGWGKRPAAESNDTWSFADRSHTTAEIILDHYRDIREAAGDDCLLIGCNTVNHLSAGVFELQRIGDDTSGMEWERVRKMGVNCLAFRGPQHGTFFAADADCVGLTEPNAIPWSLNRQWLELLSRSGTPLFISFKKGSITPEQEKEIAAALEIASKSQPLGEPLDWFDTPQPRRWKLMGKTFEFDWSDPVK